MARMSWVLVMLDLNGQDGLAFLGSGYMAR